MTWGSALVVLAGVVFILGFFAVPFPTDKMITAGLALFAFGHVIHDHYHHHV